MSKLQPGQIRDGIIAYLTANDAREGVAYEDIAVHLDKALSQPVARSSVRSYLNINTPGKFERVSPGRYRLTNARKA